LCRVFWIALKQKKFILIVPNNVGVGELPDVGDYEDNGSNTIANIADKVKGLHLPNLSTLGLGNIININGVPRAEHAFGCFGKMAEASKVKDSTTGHGEIAGIITQHAFPLYQKGFPKSLLDVFLRVTGCGGYLGNKPASGTNIIVRYKRRTINFK
jgi:phosphopentomutase